MVDDMRNNASCVGSAGSPADHSSTRCRETVRRSTCAPMLRTPKVVPAAPQKMANGMRNDTIQPLGIKHRALFVHCDSYPAISHSGYNDRRWIIRNSSRGHNTRQRPIGGYTLRLPPGRSGNADVLVGSTRKEPTVTSAFPELSLPLGGYWRNASTANRQLSRANYLFETFRDIFRRWDIAGEEK